jgi:hypothetical protein
MPEEIKPQPKKVFLPISVTLIAPPKTGKTHTGFTFPDPLVLFSFDLGYQPVLKKFKGKNIIIHDYPVPIMETATGKDAQAEVKVVWDRFQKDFKLECAKKDSRTMMIDTGTHLYEIARIARASELGQTNLLQHQYGDVYARIRALIQTARINGKCFVITHHVRDKYIDDKATGELDLDGCKIIPGEVDIVMWLDDKEITVDKKKQTITTGKITASRWREIKGLELDDPNYDDIVAMLGV